MLPIDVLVMPTLPMSPLQMKGKFKSMLNSSGGSVSRRNSAAAAVAAAEAVAAHPEGDNSQPQAGSMSTNPLFDDPSRNNPLFDSSRAGFDIQADTASSGAAPAAAAGSTGQTDASFFADDSLPVIQPRPRQVQ